MEEIKIEKHQVLSGEIGLEPKEHPVWLYKALDIKTQKYLTVIVDAPDINEELEKKIYTNIAIAFKRAEKNETVPRSNNGKMPA